MAVRQSGSAVGQDGARQSRKRQSEPVPAVSDSKRHGGAVCLGTGLRVVQGWLGRPEAKLEPGRKRVGTREEEMIRSEVKGEAVECNGSCVRCRTGDT